jgi:ethanolamine ammonia-lyase small subunit
MAPEQADSWDFLRTYTAARIALGRAGQSLPTRQLLEFQLAHAQARDAVYSELDTDRLEREVSALGPSTLTLQSSAATRAEYVRRPDFGRQLSESARQELAKHIPIGAPADLCIVLADGLSARAVQSHAVPLLAAVLPQFKHAGWTLFPVVIVQGGRVAVGDQIGHLLGASLVAVMIGERPGLSAPDSLGIYLTYGPRPGLTDESRNCISNVRPAGLPYNMAALKLFYLLHEMRNRKLSGVGLKDEQLRGQLPQEPVGGLPAY